MKKQTSFSINLQQGLIVSPDGHIMAAYSHHSKKIFCRIPYTSEDLSFFDLGGQFDGYELINGQTDGFSLQMWTTSGNKQVI